MTVFGFCFNPKFEADLRRQPGTEHEAVSEKSLYRVGAITKRIQAISRMEFRPVCGGKESVEDTKHEKFSTKLSDFGREDPAIFLHTAMLIRT